MISLAKFFHLCQKHPDIWDYTKEVVIDTHCPHEFGLREFLHNKCISKSTDCEQCWENSINLKQKEKNKNE